MKRILLVAAQLYTFFFAFADNEAIAVYTTNGPTTDPTTIGRQDLCTNIRFGFTAGTIPTNYTHIQKCDWYANGVLVLTQPNNGYALIPLKPDATGSFSVYCKTTYADDQGHSSGAYQSNSVSVNSKSLSLNPISQSAPITAGCQTPVSFSTSVNTTGLGSYDPGSAYYTINWTIPAGWSFNGPSTGFSVSVIPGSNAGTVSATLTMYCGYSAYPASLAIGFVAPPPSFASAPTAVCTGGSTANFSLNPVCGASSYTYTISQTNGTGINFTANGLQSLTTSASSVDIGFPSSGSTPVKLTAVANYPNNISSSPISTSFSFGKPQSVAITSFSNLTDCQYNVFVMLPSGGFYPFAGTLAITDGQQFGSRVKWTDPYGPPLNAGNFVDNGDGSVFVSGKTTKSMVTLLGTVSNTCGGASATFYFVASNCSAIQRVTHPLDSTFANRLNPSDPQDKTSIFPNPVSDEVNVTLPDGFDLNNAGIRIVDTYGRQVKMVRSLSHSNKIPISGLPAGIYFVEIIGGSKSLITKKIVKL